jgi:hypothetical protein
MALTKVTSGMVNPDPSDASNLSSGDVPLARLDNVDTSGITANQDDIALLAFKTQANGSLARYNLVDQSVDSFEDASGVDASTSTGENFDAAGKYYTSISYGSYGFNSNTSTGAGTWTCPTDVVSVEAVIVAGGGQGGCPYHGSGGGGGGVVYDTAYTVTPAVVYDFTIGAGGSGVATNGECGATGSDTTWNDNAEGSGVKLIAKGGGGGGVDSSFGTAEVAGGSGGGGSFGRTAGVSNQQSSGTATGGTITSYGNDGAVGLEETPGHPAGGGGGAAVEPADGTADGGAGQLFSNFTSYGESGYFGGGGGGSVYTTSGGGSGNFDGVGGVGGGGDAALSGASGTAGLAGTANTGGGGGGSERAGSVNNAGGAGGSGGIYLRYRTESVSATMSLVSNTLTAVDAVTKGDIVFTYTNQAGTASLNTDLKAYVSRDNGANYTEGTLVNQGTTGGHIIVTFHNLTLGGSDTSQMRWKVETLNQSAAKETRIQAVSLGWS